MPANDEAQDTMSVAERIRSRILLFQSIESRKMGFNYKPREDDVIISTAQKTGTTLTQHICHGLRSGGDMSFDEINLVVPLLETADAYGYGDLYAAQPFAPQMFKTHFWYNHVPKGAGKYITVVRQPVDTAVSFFHFYEDWFFKKGELTLDLFVEEFWLTRGAPQTCLQEASAIHHLMSWYPHRLDENVLWLHYEDLVQDLRGCVRLIAEFLDIGVNDDKLQDLVTKQSSLEFMKKHSTKFDEHPSKLKRNEVAGLPRMAGLLGNNSKVRSGGIDSGRNVICPSTVDKIDQRWREVVTSATGYQTYHEMREGINRELNRKFT